MSKQTSGELIESKIFTILHEGKKSTWTLLYYPNGDSVESSSNVSLFLNLVNANFNKFVVNFRLGILAKCGFKDFMGFDLAMSGEEFKLIPGFGQDKLIHYDNLFNCSNHLINGSSLTFVCEVILFHS